MIYTMSVLGNEPNVLVIDRNLAFESIQGVLVMKQKSNRSATKIQLFFRTHLFTVLCSYDTWPAWKDAMTTWERPVSVI